MSNNRRDRPRRAENLRTSETSTEPRSRWHLPAVLASWVVVIGALAWSADYNRDYALSLLTPGEVNARSEWLHAGMPATLLVALVLAELAILARAHGAARVIAMTGVAFVAVITFASSYRSILTVMASDDPNAPDWLLWGRAAVPDVLAITATVILVSLRQRAEARRKTAVEHSPKTRPGGRFARLADAATARAEAALVKPERVPASAVVEESAESIAELTSSAPPKPKPDTAPMTAPGATPTTPADLPEASADDYATARQIIDAGVTILPVETVAAVIAAAASGMSQRPLAKAVGIDRKTVSKVVAAAAQFPARTLTAVGGGAGGG